MTTVANLFERLNAGRPPLPATEDSEHKKYLSIERLLIWLTHNWPGDTITLRQIRNFGPYPLRNEAKAALDLAQDLVKRGWLSPIKPRRHDSQVWKIGPRPHHPQK
jgi:hypothetical protein